MKYSLLITNEFIPAEKKEVDGKTIYEGKRCTHDVLIVCDNPEDTEGRFYCNICGAHGSASIGYTTETPQEHWQALKEESAAEKKLFEVVEI